jgi:DNA-binding response OmpR family regulator
MLTATAQTKPPVDEISILVVEDAPEFQQLLDETLTNAGFHVGFAENGESALTMAAAANPDVIVLDLGLPGIDGIEVCRRLRIFTDAYVIMLTSRGCEVDRLVGLAVGADDYMTKPFSTRELVARVHALMRRPHSRASEPEGADGTHLHGELRVSTDSREVWVGDQEVTLTRTEFELLAILIRRPKMVFSKEMLLEQVWDSMWDGSDHVVQVHIANLRRKIDLDGRRHIKAVRGVGYRLAPVVA